MTTSRWKAPAIGTSSVAAAIFVLSLFVGGVGSSAPKSAPAHTPSPSPTVSASSTPTACAPEFKQVASDNKGGKIDPDFETKYAEATKKAGNLSDGMIKVLLDNSANNAQRLAIWANAFGLYGSSLNWQPLVSGDCLSNEGQQLFYETKGALNAAGTVVEEDDAPSDGYNSGVENGTFFVNNSKGISGNRKAIKVTFKNGLTTWILIRCGNPVFQTPQPQTPPPTKTPPPPVVHVCPPSMPHGTWPVCKDDPSAGPARTGHLPTQQQPNPLPAAPKDEQKTEPVNPGPIYTAPAKPSPKPAPVGSEPAPSPIPTPRVTLPPEPADPPADNPVNTCSPAPGKTTCD